MSQDLSNLALLVRHLLSPLWDELPPSTWKKEEKNRLATVITTNLVERMKPAIETNRKTWNTKPLWLFAHVSEYLLVLNFKMDKLCTELASQNPPPEMTTEEIVGRLCPPLELARGQRD